MREDFRIIGGARIGRMPALVGFSGGRFLHDATSILVRSNQQSLRANLTALEAHYCFAALTGKTVSWSGRGLVIRQHPPHLVRLSFGYPAVVVELTPAVASALAGALSHHALHLAGEIGVP